MSKPKPVKLTYFALLADQAGVPEEILLTQAETCAQLYQELQAKYGFALPLSHIRVAVNDAWVSLTHPLQPNDHVVFIPPVAGG
ncbi:MAG: MoaD/ThiS family protein [Gloeomargarita sp. GMQP_bins_120]